MSHSISPRRQLAHRSQLLKQVKREIKQFRLQSLHRAVLTKLAEETPPLKMRRTWDIEAKVGKHKSVKLSADSGVIPVFDRMSGKLLILGATGSGKTTTLIGLAKVLVSRALQDEAEPIPVLLNLRTWNPAMPEIAHWIIEQLKWKYDISSKVSCYWLEQLQILPLLDGLNEVPSDYRELCIQQINQWLQSDFSPIHLVVCTTVEGYYRCKSRLELNGAVLLKPLTKTQIRDYLFHAKTQALWNEIETNENLLKLAQKPLFLTLMTLAYDEILLESWKRLSSEDEQLQYLFNAYIRRQVAQHREGIEYYSAYPAEQMRQGLEWIAQRLEEDHKTEFSVDKIPVHWLREIEEERTYTWGAKFFKGIIWWSIIAGIIIAIVIQSIEMMLSIAGIGLIWGFISEMLSINSLIEQMILRRIISSKGYFPWNYKQFLEDAKQRLILQQVGDRYRFIHRWLQRQFAQLRT